MPGLIVFAAAFCVYALTASPVMGWLDSPEFVATSASLGVAHSPGHPIPALLGRMVSLFPVGDVAFRVNLASALCAAGAAVAMYAAARHLLAIAAPDTGRRAREAVAGAAGLVLAFSWAAWFQGVRAEVYALQTLLVLGTLASLFAYDRARQPRWLALAGLLGGLALANHHLIALLFLLPAAVAVLARSRARRPRAQTVMATALLGVLGLAAFLYLPVRAAQHPEVNWGAPDTASRFAWTVSAKAFQKAVGAERPTTRGEDAAQVARALAENATLPLAVAALLGLYLALRRRGWRRQALLLLAVVGFAAAGRVLVGFDPAMPDHHAYLLPGIAALILLGFTGLAVARDLLAELRPASARAGSAVLVGLALLLVPAQLLANAGESSLRNAYASDEVARWEYEGLPPRTVLLVSYFETSYRVDALRAAEQGRPDIAVLDLGFLTFPGMAEEAKRRYPELAAIIDAPLRLGARLPTTALRGLAPRPVMLQLQPDLDRGAAPWLVPIGPFTRLLPEVPTPQARAATEREDVAARRRIAARLAHPSRGDRLGVRYTLLWHDFNRLRFYCQWIRPTAWHLTEDSLLDDDCSLALLSAN